MLKGILYIDCQNQFFKLKSQLMKDFELHLFFLNYFLQRMETFFKKFCSWFFAERLFLNFTLSYFKKPFNL